MAIKGNNLNEELFVRTYVKKSRRERLLHELTTKTKRDRGLSRFCHDAAELIAPGVILMNDPNLETLPAFKDFVSRHNQHCQLFSPDPVLDLEELPFAEAVAAASFSSDAVIILSEDFACVFGEALKGGRDKYLLCRQEK